MEAGNKFSSNPKSASKDKKRKRSRSYLPHNKPVKKKGSYPLHPGVQGFFITCDGGREIQASQEAINVIDTYYEELVLGEDSDVNHKGLSMKPLNTKIKFSYSDSSSSENESDEEEQEQVVDEGKEEEEQKEEKGNEELKSGNSIDKSAIVDAAGNEESVHQKVDGKCLETQTRKDCNSKEEANDLQTEGKSPEGPPEKKQCLETDVRNSIPITKPEKSVDELIEEELKELTDKNKRRFVQLDSGCTGVVFIEMRTKAGDPGPTDIVHHMVTSVASTKKHMSRFILRILPIEVGCYASEEDITRAIKPFVEKYFPTETQNPEKFAVLYESRYNTGVDRMKIINAVAKSIPAPHKVDLNNPRKTIIVEIVKTVCLIGIADKYKELAKYNLRQLTSSKP